MLRIVDVLLECFLFELMYDPIAFDYKSNDSMSIREKVEHTMETIGVTSFKFIPPAKKTKTTKWTWHTLMGPAKLRIIKNFPVSNFIIGNRGKDIENLWKKFYSLYRTIQCSNLSKEDIIQFSKDAREWVQNFARPTLKTSNGQIIQKGLYQRSDITPYMHVLANHVPLFMQVLYQKNLYLEWFTTSSTEKKNHDHVSAYIL